MKNTYSLFTLRETYKKGKKIWVRAHSDCLPGCCRAFIVKSCTGSRAYSTRAPPDIGSAAAQSGGEEDVGMLTSASQRFDWKKTAVGLTDNGLRTLEESRGHVTFPGR